MTKNRLETFSDSLIAIVITLLAMGLRVPIDNSFDSSMALSALKILAPQFFIFVLSFITISIMWINHHYITNKIEVVTHKTVWTNSILLMLISMIPFATDFLGRNPANQIALIVYSTLMLLCSLAFTLFKASSLAKGTKTHKRETFKHIGIYVYSLAIIIAFLRPEFTYLVLAVPPMSYILPRKE